MDCCYKPKFTYSGKEARRIVYACVVACARKEAWNNAEDSSKGFDAFSSQKGRREIQELRANPHFLEGEGREEGNEMREKDIDFSQLSF